jgi:uncharacterized protein (TIGR02266 family)
MKGDDDTRTSAGADAEAADKRRHERQTVILRVDYDGADDLVGDYTDNLSLGGTFVATTRALPIGTEVRLVLSFPGLLEPVAIDGAVRWTRDDDDPGVGIEFAEGPSLRRLTEVIERIRARDPRTVSRLIKVLVVEDNPHVANLIAQGLHGSARRDGEDLAFAFRTASNGKEALARLAEERFDAMIVDVYLPIVDGAHVIAAARGELGLADLPIIAVSAGGENARRAAVAAGADIFLDKPMRLRQVMDTMRALVGLRAR